MDDFVGTQNSQMQETSQTLQAANERGAAALDITDGEQAIKSLVVDLTQTLNYRAKAAQAKEIEKKQHKELAVLGVVALPVTAVAVVLAMMMPWIIIPAVLIYAFAGVKVKGYWQERYPNEKTLTGGINSQTEAETRFRTLQNAVKGMVDPGVEKPIVSALNDAYAISQSMERYPNLEVDSASTLSDMIGQTLVAGAILAEMTQYEKTRWEPNANVQVDLASQQEKMRKDLKKEQVHLRDTVSETTLQLSLIRGEVLRLEAQAVLEKSAQTTLSTLLDQVRAMRLSLEEVNQTSQTRLRELVAQTA